MRAQTSTPLAVTSLISSSPAGEDLAVVVASGRFDWPPLADEAPTLSAEQPPVELIDSYHGEPQSSSLRWEGQSTYARPGTDIYVHGHASTLAGHPKPMSEVVVRVGHCERRALVFGERVWERGRERLMPTLPRPFTKIPLTYERAFGGPGSEANPVGRGLFASEAEAEGQPLPNLEDPELPLTRVADRPPPVGFGPVARHWLARRRFAGTYDRSWLETRAPLWPKDMDERLFCAASPGLCAIPHLLGGELVVVEGLSALGPTRFRLPSIRLEATFAFVARAVSRALILDAVALDGDARTVTMIWRTSVPAHAKLSTLRTIDVVERRG